MADPMPTVGLFGLGLIGSAVARRLCAAGFPVVGHDPDASRCAELAGLGGRAGAPRDVWQSDVVFSCVFDTGQLAELIRAAPDCRAVLVSVSTCGPDQMPGLAGQAAAKGITLIEAPVSGTSRALAEGTALLILAGDPGAADRIAPVLDALATARRHVGPIGNGNRAKLAINLVLGLNRAALAEGLVFAEKLGLDAERFLDLARVSAAQSAVMDSKGAKMARREFSPQGRIAQSAKDFTLILDGAAAAGQGLPFARTYLQMMQAALAAGEGDLDNAAVLLPISRSRPE